MDVFTLVVIVTLATGEERTHSWAYRSRETCYAMVRHLSQGEPRVKAYCQPSYKFDTPLEPKREG